MLSILIVVSLDNILLIILVVLGGDLLLFLSSDHVAACSPTVLGDLMRHGFIQVVASTTDRFGRHLLLRSYVHRCLGLHLALKVLVEDSKLVGVLASLHILLAIGAIPLDVDIDDLPCGRVLGFGGDAAFGSLARRLQLLMMMLLALD